MITSRRLAASLLLFLLVLLSACGNKGDLVRPTAAPEAPAKA